MAEPSAYLARDGTYDVGRLVRSLHTYYLGEGPPNRATRANVLELLGVLRQLTLDLGLQDILGPTVDSDQWHLDLEAWRVRLNGYLEAAERSPSGHSHELASEVVAPLLLGLYPDDDVRKPADVATPYSLANQAKVSREWRRERLELLMRDVVVDARKLATSWVTLLALALGSALTGLLAGLLLTRKP